MFEAIIAPHVPELLVVRADIGGSLILAPDGAGFDQPPKQVYELRSFVLSGGAHPLFMFMVLKALGRNGIHPVLHGTVWDGSGDARLIYLIGFDSLEARAKAWDELAADPEAPLGLGYQVSFYRRLA